MRPPNVAGRAHRDELPAALTIIGALNWGLVGAFHLDIVATLFGIAFGQTSPGRHSPCS